MRTRFALAGAMGLAMAAAAGAQPVIDGVAEPIYGPARVVQNTQTGFGDNNLGLPDFANGSELDGAYGFIAFGGLYLVFAGNLESNFNKLEVFIDSRPFTGQNRLRGNNADVDFNGLNRMGDDGSGNGLTFEAGFAPDYYITVTGGGNPYLLFGSFAELPTAGGGGGVYLGSGERIVTADNGIQLAIDNSNTAGVAAGNGLGSGAGVVRGIEMRIPLSLIDASRLDDVRVCAFINGQGHDFVSNQVLGGLGGGPNLGEPRAINFQQRPGVNTFSASPAGRCCLPGSCRLLSRDDCFAAVGRWGGYDTVCLAANSYAAEVCGSVFEDISGAPPLDLACDDCGVTIPIGFVFNFFGVARTEVGVSSNGYLTFGGDLREFLNAPIPSMGVPNDLIAVNWDDLDGASGTITSAVLGEPGSRRLIVQWTNVAHIQDQSARHTFQVALFEGTDVIKMRYESMPPPGGFITPMAGVENGDGTAGTLLNTGQIFPGYSWRFEYLTAPPIFCERCRCDWNHDDLLNSQDFFDYLLDFFAGNGDFDGCGNTNSQDFYDFLNCFFSGCL